MKTLKKKLTVITSKGIHGRIATNLVKIAAKNNVKLSINYEGKTIDCSSVLHILSLALPQGAKLTIHISGDDPDSAMQAVENLLAEEESL